MCGCTIATGSAIEEDIENFRDFRWPHSKEGRKEVKGPLFSLSLPLSLSVPQAHLSICARVYTRFRPCERNVLMPATAATAAR
jgi:hypothetical protein